MSTKPMCSAPPERLLRYPNRISSTVEVVTLFEVRDQSGVYWLLLRRR
ncbi:hypothetical protein [Paenibacillus polymyxa]|nr:hypothetical protein [Paenibacillus polymyxa]